MHVNGRWLSLVALVAFFGLWELSSASGWVSPVLISSPSAVASAAVKLAKGSMLWADLAYTLRAFALAFVLALGLGASLGALIGLSRAAYHVVHPFVIAGNSVPKVVLMPLVILWVGMGMSANVVLGALMAGFPIILSTHAGVQALERDYVRLARAFGAGRSMFLRTIVMPGSMPFVAAGARVAVNYAMVGVLISEFFGSSRGVGHRMMLFMANFQVASFFVYLLLAASVTLLAAASVRGLEARLLRWRPPPEAAPGGL